MFFEGTFPHTALSFLNLRSLLADKLDRRTRRRRSKSVPISFPTRRFAQRSRPRGTRTATSPTRTSARETAGSRVAFARPGLPSRRAARSANAWGTRPRTGLPQRTGDRLTFRLAAISLSRDRAKKKHECSSAFVLEIPFGASGYFFPEPPSLVFGTSMPRAVARAI